MQTKTVTVTPGQAAKWLLSNAGNRNLRNRTVRQYAADIKAGRWAMTGDAIRFDEQGRLVDGQHRLQACVEAGEPFTTLVMRGVDDQARLVLDSGVKRTFADTLKFLGEKNSLHLAATARMCWLYENTPNPVRTTFPPSHSQMMAWVEANRAEAHAGVDEGIRVRQHLTVPVPAIALPFIYGHRAAPEDNADFFEKLRSGIDLQEGSPVLALRRYFELLRPRRRKPQSAHLCAYVIKAHNHYRLGNEVDVIHWRAGGKTAEPYPRIAADDEVLLGLAS